MAPKLLTLGMENHQSTILMILPLTPNVVILRKLFGLRPLSSAWGSLWLMMELSMSWRGINLQETSLENLKTMLNHLKILLAECEDEGQVPGDVPGQEFRLPLQRKEVVTMIKLETYLRTSTAGG